MEERMSLYKLNKTMKEIIDNGFTFDEETGEIIFTTDDIEKLEMATTDKINNIVGYIKDLDIETKTLKNISDEYKERAENKKKKSEKLKKYLDEYLTNNNIEKKEVTNGTVSYRKTVATRIYDERALLNYIKIHPEVKDRYTTTEIKFSKTEIGKDLKAKEDLVIDGVELKTNKNLQIK